MAKKDPMAGLPEGHLTLEEAKQVINAHREAERAAERDKLLPLVGKYFKYWNNYGVGGKTQGWWLYAHVTGVDTTPMCTGWTLQRDENGRIEVDAYGRSTITIKPEGSGWREITVTEFWDAATSIRRLVDAQLTKPARKKTHTKKRSRSALRRRASKAEGR